MVLNKLVRGTTCVTSRNKPRTMELLWCHGLAFMTTHTYTCTHVSLSFFLSPETLMVLFKDYYSQTSNINRITDFLKKYLTSTIVTLTLYSTFLK